MSISKKWIIAIALIVIYLIVRYGMTSYLDRMAKAIQIFEGWKPGSVSYNNNNPGNLKFANQPGAIASDSQGHAIFDTVAHGWQALLNQLKAAFNNTSAVYNSGMSLYQFFSKYAEANSKEYAEYVAAALGVSANDTLENIKANV